MSEPKVRKSKRKSQPILVKLIDDLRSNTELDTLQAGYSHKSMLDRKIEKSPLKFKKIKTLSKTNVFSDSSTSLTENSTDNATSYNKQSKSPTPIQNKQQMSKQYFERNIRKNSGQTSRVSYTGRAKQVDENLLRKANGIKKSEYQIVIAALVAEVELLSGKNITDYLQISKLQKLMKNSNEDIADNVFNYLMPNFNMPYRNYK